MFFSRFHRSDLALPGVAQSKNIHLWFAKQLTSLQKPTVKNWITFSRFFNSFCGFLIIWHLTGYFKLMQAGPAPLALSGLSNDKKGDLLCYFDGKFPLWKFMKPRQFHMTLAKICIFEQNWTFFCGVWLYFASFGSYCVFA